MGSFCAAGLSLLFLQLCAENGFSCVAAQFKSGHGHSCGFRDCTVRTHVGLLLWAVLFGFSLCGLRAYHVGVVVYCLVVA